MDTGADAIKVEFHVSSFLIASSWHLREDVANMSRGNLASCVGRGCYDYPRKDIGCVGEDRGVYMYSKGGGVWRSNLPYFKSVQVYNISRSVQEGLDASGRGCHKNGTRKLLPWNLSFT